MFLQLYFFPNLKGIFQTFLTENSELIKVFSFNFKISQVRKIALQSFFLLKYTYIHIVSGYKHVLASKEWAWMNILPAGFDIGTIAPGNANLSHDKKCKSHQEARIFIPILSMDLLCGCAGWSGKGCDTEASTARSRFPPPWNLYGSQLSVKKNNPPQAGLHCCDGLWQHPTKLGFRLLMTSTAAAARHCPKPSRKAQNWFCQNLP